VHVICTKIFCFCVPLSQAPPQWGGASPSRGHPLPHTLPPSPLAAVRSSRLRRSTFPHLIPYLWTVASPGFGARRGTKLRENNLRVTQKYVILYHTVTAELISLSRRKIPYTVFFQGGNGKPHGVECWGLCGCEVTGKLNSRKSRGAHAPVPHSWRSQCLWISGSATVMSDVCGASFLCKYWASIRGLT